MEPCCYPFLRKAWWRHQMGTFSALLAICAGNSPVHGEFPTQRPVTRGFDIFFDLSLNKRLSKRSRGWWFETLSCPLWRQCNGSHVFNSREAVATIHCTYGQSKAAKGSTSEIVFKLSLTKLRWCIYIAFKNRHNILRLCGCRSLCKKCFSFKYNFRRILQG